MIEGRLSSGLLCLGTMTPTTAFGSCNAGVTSGTERQKVLRVMGAASTQGNDMVHLPRRRNPTLFGALGAQGMLRNIPGPDFAPCRAVALAGCRVSLVLRVPPGLLLCMGRAEPAVCQFGATGMAAWARWLPGHSTASFARKKPPERWLQRLCCLFTSLTVSVYHILDGISSAIFLTCRTRAVPAAPAPGFSCCRQMFSRCGNARILR